MKEKILNILGLNIKLKKELKTIIITDILSFVFISICILIKALVTKNYDFNNLASHLSIIGALVYGLFCLFQEILARGLLQRYLKRALKNSILAIIITTIIFLLFHINYDIITIAGALLISIITGIITDKRDDILVSFLFHWIVGGFGYIFISSPY